MTTGARTPGGTAPGTSRPTAASADVGGLGAVVDVGAAGAAAGGDNCPLQPACPTTATNVTRVIKALLGMARGAYERSQWRHEHPSYPDAKAPRRRFEVSTDSCSGMYSDLLRVFGRRMRHPYTVPDLSLALTALSEGFAMQAMTDTDHPHLQRTDLGPRVGSDRTLFACAAEGVIEHFTECDPATNCG